MPWQEMYLSTEKWFFPELVESAHFIKLNSFVSQCFKTTPAIHDSFYNFYFIYTLPSANPLLYGKHIAFSTAS